MECFFHLLSILVVTNGDVDEAGSPFKVRNVPKMEPSL